MGMSDSGESNLFSSDIMSSFKEFDRYFFKTTSSVVASNQLDSKFSIDSRSLLLFEISAVSCALRKIFRDSSRGITALLSTSLEGYESNTTRWNTRSAKPIENPITAEFDQLDADIRKTQDLLDFDALRLVKPFLSTLLSPQKDPFMTMLAVNSIQRLVYYDIINNSTPNVENAARQIIKSITHCRYERSTADQLLFYTLDAIRFFTTKFDFDLFGDESVCEIIETCLSICCQLKLPEVLRKTSESTILSIIQVVFYKLKSLPIIPENFYDSNLEINDTAFGTNQENLPQDIEAKLFDESTEISQSKPLTFGLGCMREILRVFVGLIDLKFKQNELIKLMALKVLNVILETSGKEIGQQPHLRKIMIDDMCRFLLPLLRSESAILLKFSLQLLVSFLFTMRPYMKLQQEVLIGYLLNCILIKPKDNESSSDNASTRSSLSRSKTKINSLDGENLIVEKCFPGYEGEIRSGEVKEIIIEYLFRLGSIKGFTTDLYINYDSDANFGNLYNDFITMMTLNVIPQDESPNNLYISKCCIDFVFSIVETFFTNLNLDPKNCILKPEQVEENVKQKQVIMTACHKFNQKPKDGIEFIKSQIIGSSDDKPDTDKIAQFLYDNFSIDKQVMGEYLSRSDQSDILKSMISLFDFREKRVDEALREILQCFRLPGESQQIERIVEAFASRYIHESKSNFVADADSAFVLAYSIIMLNTDQHKPKLKSRMTFEDFSKNLRSLNNGKDFDTDYLRDIYKAIQSNEIIMAEEHDSEESFNIAWSDLIATSQRHGNFYTSNGSNTYDQQMYSKIWIKLIDASFEVFRSALDDNLFPKIIDSFIQNAQIAQFYKLPKVVDYILQNLGRFTGILKYQGLTAMNNASIKDDETSQLMTVSSLSVMLGSNMKAQIATIIFFRICSKYRFMIRESWKLIFQILQVLFKNSLLTKTYFPCHRFFAIDPIIITAPFVYKKSEITKSTGLFSTISSYLNYSDDHLNVPKVLDIEKTSSSLDCVKSSQIDSFFQYIFNEHDNQEIVFQVLTHGTYVVDQIDDIYELYAFLFKLEIAISVALKSKNIFLSGSKFLQETLFSLINSNFVETQPIVIPRLLCLYFGLLKIENFYNLSTLDIELSLSMILPTLQKKAIRNHSKAILEALYNSIDKSMFTKVQFFDILAIFHIETDTIEFLSKILNHIANDSDINLLDKILRQYKRMSESISLEKGSNYVENKDKYKYIGLQCVDQLYQICCKLDKNLENAWDNYWKPIFQVQLLLCVCKWKEVRTSSIRSMQRELISCFTPKDTEIQYVYSEVLFTLLKHVLQVENKLSLKEFCELLSLVINLLFKIYLHYFIHFPNYNKKFELWNDLLDQISKSCEQYSNQELVSEAIRESVRNILLVMDSSGIALLQQENSEAEKIWNGTWVKLSKLAPNLKIEMMTGLENA